MNEPEVGVGSTLYVGIDHDELAHATSPFAEAVQDIAHHEIGDGWEVHEDIPAEIERLEHRFDQMSEAIKTGRESLLRLRMIGAIRAVWAQALTREGFPVGGEVEEDLIGLTHELSLIYMGGVSERDAPHQLVLWGSPALVERVDIDHENEDEYERVEAAADRVLAEAARAAWAAVTPASAPERMVDSLNRLWKREPDGFRREQWQTPRTHGELVAVGARPVLPAPPEEVQSVRLALAALPDGAREATARAALDQVRQKLEQRYRVWDGTYPLVAVDRYSEAGQDLLAWAREPVRPEADLEVAATVAATVASWLVGRYVVAPQDVHAALAAPPTSKT